MYDIQDRFRIEQLKIKIIKPQDQIKNNIQEEYKVVYIFRLPNSYFFYKVFKSILISNTPGYITIFLNGKILIFK